MSVDGERRGKGSESLSSCLLLLREDDKMERQEAGEKLRKGSGQTKERNTKYSGTALRQCPFPS